MSFSFPFFVVLYPGHDIFWGVARSFFSQSVPGWGIELSGRPGGVSGYARAWYMSISCVRIPPSAYSHKFVGTFAWAQIDLRKARERELATLDEKNTSSGIAEPYAR